VAGLRGRGLRKVGNNQHGPSEPVNGKDTARRADKSLADAKSSKKTRPGPTVTRKAKGPRRVALEGAKAAGQTPRNKEDCRTSAGPNITPRGMVITVQNRPKRSKAVISDTRPGSATNKDREQQNVENIKIGTKCR